MTVTTMATAVSYAVTHIRDSKKHSVPQKSSSLNFQSPKPEVYKRTAGVIITVVHNLFLSVCDFSVPSVNYNGLCQTSIKQRHQYVPNLKKNAN
jgi:hypothetical protein